jgi:hypothetical protein
MEIMSARLYRFVLSLGLSILACGAAAAATDLVLQKVPALTVEQVPAYPENVARFHSGAAVQALPRTNPGSALELSSRAQDANTAEAALLCSDPTVGYALSNGTTSLIVSLSRIENIDSVSLLNHGAKGDVTVSVSNSKLPASSAQWRQVSRQPLTSDAFKAKVGPNEAKYVKLTFEVSDPGRISALGIYPAPTIASFTMPRVRQPVSREQSKNVALISCNLTDLHAKARALYVSSGADPKQANNMIDDQPATTYAFGATDATPTAVLDLGKVTTLRRISAIYSPRAGNIDFFVLQALPNTASDALHLDGSVLNAMTHVGSVTDGSGRAAVDFPETSGRYIVLKWTAASQEGTPFSVAEVAAFGGIKDGSLLAANKVHIAAERLESDGKAIQDGKDLGEGKDAKDIPAEGAEAPAEGPGPGLPQPPPFTFIPEIVPTSP